ncbi:MAG: DUF4139 domain-containing protein [Desulfovibrio sp.]|uniref:DUF4139 domain-containing protein n=1 Tax=Desulfovibrio sp. 7SRBS1 TaxID=3378064 RepID=UPI003B3C67F4
MRNRFTPLLFLFFIALSFTCFPAYAQTNRTLTEAILYPEAAQLTEVINSSHTQNQFSFTLPLQAEPQSILLKMLTPGLAISDISSKLIPAEPGQQVKELQHQIRLKQMEFNKASAKLTALNAQVEFWKSLRMNQQPTAQTAKHLASQMGAGLNEVVEQALRAKEEFGDVDTELKNLKKQLAQMTGDAAQIWRIDVTTEGSTTKPVQVQASYRMNGCGWEPIYRVSATPDQKQVTLTFDAMVWQSTGRVWTAPVFLATLPPRQQLTPPTLRPWVIAPLPPVNTTRDTPAVMLEAASIPATRQLKVQNAPVKQRQTTYAAWSLGKHTITPGDKQRLRISDSAMESTFSYLLRPSLSDKSFLSAKVETPEPLDMPWGTALILLDGAVVAKKTFSFQGNKKDLFFGNDPQVTVKSRVIDQKSGTSGVFSSKQTYAWKWELTITNDKTVPVKTTLQEPMPRAGDEKIILKTQFSVPPTREEDNKYTWDLEIPAGSKKVITWGVTLEAPEDMSLDKGWR